MTVSAVAGPEVESVGEGVGMGFTGIVAGKFALLACLASTLFMTGLIWFVQVVHYPLFSEVEPGDFLRYHAAHPRRTTRVVLLSPGRTRRCPIESVYGLPMSFALARVPTSRS